MSLSSKDFAKKLTSSGLSSADFAKKLATPAEPIVYDEEFGPPIAPPAETNWEGGYSPEATANLVEEIRGSSDSGVRQAALNNVNTKRKTEITPSDRPQLPYAEMGADGGSEATALARGARSGLTLGYDDEIGGAGRAAFELATGGDWDYGKYRDEIRKANQESETEHPYLYGGAKLAGNIATGAVTGAASIPALAGLGAVQGLGESEADNLAGLAEDTAIGGAIGGVAGAAGKGLARAIPAVGRGLSRTAESIGKRALGITGRQADNLPRGAVRQALDKGAVKLLGTTESNLARVKNIDADAGREIANLVDQLDTAGGKVDVTDLAQALQNRIDELSAVPGTANKTLVNQLNREMKALLNAPVHEIPISKLEEMKRAFQAKSNYNPMSDTGAVRKQGTKDIASIYKDASEGAAMATDPALGQQFIDAKSTVGNMKQIQKAARKTANQDKDLVEQALGLATGRLGNVVGAGAGAAYGGYTAGQRSNWDPTKVAAGAAGGALGGLALSRGPSAAAVSADVLGTVLQKAPQLFGKHAKALMAAAQRSGTSLAATSYALAARDPEFKRILERIMNSNPEDINADNMER